MNLISIIDSADKYASLRAYDCIDTIRNTKETEITNESVKETLWFIDNNRVEFDALKLRYNKIPQIDIESIKHDYDEKLLVESDNAIENMFNSIFTETNTEFLTEYNKRNANKLQMLRLFNDYINLRIDNTVSKALLPIFGNIGTESEIEKRLELDTRATVSINDISPVDSLDQVESIGNRLYNIFFSDLEIGSSKKVIEDTLADPEVKHTPSLRRVMTSVIDKYSIVDTQYRDTYESKSLVELYNRLGFILMSQVKSSEIDSNRLSSLISDIIIVLECIFILSNDRCNIL